MKSVIIEGSITPAVGVLARGERRACALTPHVQDLIDKGFVNLVEVLDDPPAKPRRRKSSGVA